MIIGRQSIGGAIRCFLYGLSCLLIFAVMGSEAWGQTTGICGRTQQVRDAIVARVSGITDCANITATHLSSLTGTLALIDRSITTLQTDDFAGLTALTRLYLNRNQLRTLPTGVFADLTALTWLGLSNNQLRTLPTGVFADLTALTRLDLDHNQLRTLPTRVFANLTALTRLILVNNQLRTLPAGVFANLTALTGLTLNNNKLQTLPAGVFADLTRLTRLDLGSNQLQTLPAGVFADLTTLTMLFLDNNQLQTLPAGVFTGLTNLSELQLQGNAVDLLQLPVSIVPTIGRGLVKATIPSGAPFALTLPITVTNGNSVNSITIATGNTESEAFIITRTDASRPSDVNIDTLPEDLPAEHKGYVLVKSGLPLQLFEPGVTISQTILNIDEGSSGSYTVRLNDVPPGQVMVMITSNNRDITTSPESLTFTTIDWHLVKTVTVNARRDNDALNDTATLSHGVTGYGNVTSAPAVRVTVNETLIPDMDGNNSIDAEDAIILFIYTLGDSPEAQENLLRQRIGNSDLAQAMARAKAWERNVASGDLNLDGDVDDKDALIIYYAEQFEDLLQAPGQATLRRLLLDDLRGGMPATDAGYRQLLRRAETLR